MKIVSLMLIIAVNASCRQTKPIQKELPPSKFVTFPATETLKFTSGIRAIFQDSTGNYWFGSLQEGVAMYNGKSLTYFTNQEGLTDNQIHSIKEDRDGNIWFNTQTGASSYNGTQMVNHTDVAERTKNVSAVQDRDSAADNWTKSEFDLWFEAGNRAGVYRYDGQRLRYLNLPPQNLQNASENMFAVTGISEGKNDMIWFATYSAVFGYNGIGFTIINDETLGYDRKTASLHIRSILEDSKGRLWIGNNGTGIVLKTGDSIIDFSKKHHLIRPNGKRNSEVSPPGTLEHVFAIAEDQYGNIWFGDRDTGVWKYDGIKFENYTIKDRPDNDAVLAIYQDRNKNMWFGTVYGKVYTFNGKTFEKQF